MALHSENLSYVRLNESHFEDFKKLALDPEVMKYYRQMPKSEAEARESFMKYIHYMNAYPHLGAWAVYSKHENKFLGISVVIHIELRPEHGKYEIGYRLAQSAWGKGYATEIAKALVAYCFNDLNLSEIFGTTNPDNIASQKVLMKAGLTCIGEAPYYEGSTFFKLARDQWK